MAISTIGSVGSVKAWWTPQTPVEKVFAIAALPTLYLSLRNLQSSIDSYIDECNELHGMVGQSDEAKNMEDELNKMPNQNGNS